MAKGLIWTANPVQNIYQIINEYILRLNVGYISISKKKINLL